MTRGLHARQNNSYFRPKPYQFDDYAESGEDLDRVSIARSGVRGSAATLSGTWIKFVFLTASTIALAHLLSPADFGLVAMVTAISGFADLMRDLGLTFATIQSPRLSREQASALFWYSSGLGAITALTLVALGPIITRFYHQPHIAIIIPVLAAALFVESLGSQHIALLDRSLGFTRVMVSDIVSAAVSCPIAIVLAALGAGYWALVAMAVSQSVMRTVLAWINVRWIPGKPARFRDASSLVFFGSNLFVAQVLNYFSRNLDNVIVGRLFGAKILGQYAQAYTLLLLPLQQVNAPLQRVAVPLLSRTVVNPALYRDYFRMAIRLMTLILIPIFCTSAILSTGLVRLLLGPQWSEAAGLFRILCIAGITQSLGYASSWLFISTGQGRRQLIWALFSRPIVVCSFFVGAQWGVHGLALAYALTSAAMVIPAFLFAMRGTPARMIDLVAGMKELAIMLPVLSGIAFFVNRQMHANGFSISVSFIVAAGSCGIAYLAMWILIPSCRSTVKRLLTILRSPEAVV